MLQGALNPQGGQEEFEKYFVQPAQQAHERFTVPGIQQRFADLDAGSSSALNQALAQSAADLSTQIGSQYGQFRQNQVGQALGAFAPLVSQQTFSPMIRQNEGWGNTLLGGVGQGFGTAFGRNAGLRLSTEMAKENIKEYTKGLEELSKLDVKQYDYKEEYGGEKDKVGLIAEQVPDELTNELDGLRHVDIYGLVGLLINSIKDLKSRVEELEGAV